MLERTGSSQKPGISQIAGPERVGWPQLIMGIRYVHADIAAAIPAGLAADTFDAVTCNFGLSDIDDLDGAIATVQAVLKPDPQWSRNRPGADEGPVYLVARYLRA